MHRHLGATLATLSLPALAAGLRSQGKATVSAGVHSTLGSGYRIWPPKDDSCNEAHVDDLYRPIKQVAREHPGQDMNCWFHWYADYLFNPPSYVDLFYSTVSDFSPVNGDRGPAMQLYLNTGEVLKTHNGQLLGMYGSFAYDDSMCYQMGWMKGQRLDDKIMSLKSEEEWFKVAEEECQRMPTLVNSTITDENSEYMTVGYMQDDNNRIVSTSMCNWMNNSWCKKATMEDWVEHLYPKCLLGKDDRLTGAAGQIAWCFARACVTEGNVIKHGAECWPEGLPNLGASPNLEGAREAQQSALQL